MKYFSIRRLPFILSLAAVLFLAPTLARAQKDKDWRPVTPEELAEKTPTVEPDADVEASFWEVRVDDSSTDGVSMKHYVRLKIFTERGREQFSSRDIQFGKNTKIKDVEARVTKPDGTVTVLNKDDVHERDIIKADGFKVKAKSFALPGLEVGSVLEYRYREVWESGNATMPLIYQRDVPIKNISYYIKPFGGTLAMGYHSFNGAPAKFEKDKGDFYRGTMTNVPALHEEPSMLPINEIRPWTYIYYQTGNEPKTAGEYWQNLSKVFYDVSKDFFKVNDDVKTVTNQVIAGATTDDEKLHRIFDYVKTLRNISYASNVTDDDKKQAKAIKTGADALKMKMGSGGDIDAAFGSMARAAGFETRLALSGDRSEKFFDPRVTIVRLVLGSSSVAVKVGDDWKFFSPASYYTPYGMLTWKEEDQQALVTDSKELIWKHIPLTGSDVTMDKRSGHFKLLEDGTLEGEARIEFTGHRAYYMKNLNHGDSSAEQENTLKDMIKANILGTTEVQNFTIENAADPAKPFVYTFKIRVPGYASRTGKRLFFQPNVFERSSKPRFTSSARKYDVYFSYPYSEQDDITIDLPAGFSLESADAPDAIKDSQGIASHETVMNVSADGHTLRYKRAFSFGNGGFIRFPATSYPAVKSLFEAFNKADVHQLTLRQAAPKN